LVLVTSIAVQSRANGNVSYGHSPTTNVGNPTALCATTQCKPQDMGNTSQGLLQTQATTYSFRIRSMKPSCFRFIFM